MSYEKFRLTDDAISANGVEAAPDKLTGTTQENKKVFDRLIRAVVKDIINGLAAQIGADVARFDSGEGKISAETAAALKLDEGATLNDALVRLKNMAASGGIPTAEFVAVSKATAEAYGLEGDVTVDMVLQVVVDAITEATTKSYTKEETLSPTTKTALGLGENATPDNAFNALADVMPKVGDTLTTARTDLDDSWVLCNGDVLAPSEYKKLEKVLPRYGANPQQLRSWTANDGPPNRAEREWIQSGDSIYMSCYKTTGKESIFEFAPVSDKANTYKFREIQSNLSNYQINMVATDDGSVYVMCGDGSGNETVYSFANNKVSLIGSYASSISVTSNQAFYSKDDNALVLSNVDGTMFIFYLDTQTSTTAKYSRNSSASIKAQLQLPNGKLVRIESIPNESTVVANFYDKATSLNISESISFPQTIPANYIYSVSGCVSDGAAWVLLSTTTLQYPCGVYKISSDYTIEEVYATTSHKGRYINGGIAKFGNSVIVEGYKNNATGSFIQINLETGEESYINTHNLSSVNGMNCGFPFNSETMVINGVLYYPTLIWNSTAYYVFNTPIGIKTPTISQDSAYTYIKAKE